jgi:hypothetical protein
VLDGVVLIPPHPSAAIADLGRVGPHYPGQDCEWIIVLRDETGTALEVHYLAEDQGQLDQGHLSEMISLAELRLGDSGYLLGDRSPVLSTWAVSWAVDWADSDADPASGV